MIRMIVIVVVVLTIVNDYYYYSKVYVAYFTFLTILFGQAVYILLNTYKFESSKAINSGFIFILWYENDHISFLFYTTQWK